MTPQTATALKIAALPVGEAHAYFARLQLDRPAVMGIVNLTPDSFSGDGVGDDASRAIAHAWAQLEAGADLLDLGAESSRPGALPVPRAGR